MRWFMREMSSSDAECSESDTSTSLSKHYYIMPCISNTRLCEIDLEHLSNEQYLNEIYNPSMMTEPPVPKSRKSIRSEDTEKFYCFKNKSHKLHMTITSVLENEESSTDDSIEYEEQIERNQNETDKNKQSCQNRSRTISPEKKNPLKKKEFVQKCSTSKVSSPKSRTHYLIIPLLGIILFIFMLPSNNTQQLINQEDLLFKFIKDVKTKFHNQESDSWNDISSAINEIISGSPKGPSIILLFANETNTMDCLATELAHGSDIILRTDHPYKNLYPKDFGDDAGDIIETLKEKSPSEKVIVIRDILNINTEGIKALHFLCDRVNPLINEAIYILTMQTNNYQPSKKRLICFVESYIRRKFSKSIDQDILMPLITRITDGAVIWVQPESNLEQCGN